MYNFLFIVEFIISLIYLKEVITFTGNIKYEMLLVLLIYLCTKVVYYIFTRNKYIKILLFISLLQIVLFSKFTFGPMSYFLFLSLIQLFDIKKKTSIVIFILSIVFGLFIEKEYIQNFILINVFILVVFYFVEIMLDKNKRLLKRITQCESDLITLKKENSLLRQYELSIKHTSKLEERNIIAQKLHDELGHTLSGSTMQLEAVKMLLETDKEKSKDMINTVIDVLRNGSDSIRKILKSVQPETASMNIEIVKELALNTQKKSGILIDIIYNKDIADLDFRKWSVICLNVKESLTNMMKYSNATNCVIKFERLNKVFKVSIEDDGNGCSTVINGMGLQGIEERLLNIDSKLIVDGSNGFKLIMLISI